MPLGSGSPMTSPRVAGPSLPHGLGRFAQEQAEKSGDFLLFMGYPTKNWIYKLLANLDKIYIFHGEKRTINHGSVKQVYGRF